LKRKVCLRLLTGNTAAMSAENVELVRAAMFPDRLDLVALFVGGDLEGAIDLSAFADDTEIVFASRSGPPVEYRGMDGLREGWLDWLAPWSRYDLEVEDLIDAGDKVVAYALLSGETRHGGVEIEQKAAAVATVADGMIVRVEFHLDRREALQAAGIGE
jgi:ketosteroid isomerase-like protein